MEDFKGGFLSDSEVINDLVEQYGEENLVETAVRSLSDPQKIAEFLAYYTGSIYDHDSYQNFGLELEKNISQLKSRYEIWQKIDEQIMIPDVEAEFCFRKALPRKYSKSNIVSIAVYQLVKRMKKNPKLEQSRTFKEKKIELPAIDEAVTALDNPDAAELFYYHLYDYYAETLPFPSIKAHLEIKEAINRRLKNPIEYWETGLKAFYANEKNERRMQQAALVLFQTAQNISQTVYKLLFYFFPDRKD